MKLFIGKLEFFEFVKMEAKGMRVKMRLNNLPPNEIFQTKSFLKFYNRTEMAYISAVFWMDSEGVKKNGLSH